MRKYVWRFPVSLPGGNYCVVTASVPVDAKDIYDKDKAPHRRFWTSYKLFKCKANADKFLAKIGSEQRNFNLTQQLVEKGLFSLN